MSQDQSIPRRNKVDWHMANDDPILTTMRFIPQHEVVQRYGAILPDYLTNPAMKESEAYKTYHDLATGKVQPKPKYVRRSSRTKTDEAPKPSFGKRVKATAKVAKSGKKKQPALGLEALSDIALTEAEQMKLAIERSKTQLHSSQPSGSGAHEGTGVSPGVPDAPTYQSDDEEISCKSSDEDDDDEVNVSENEDDDDDERTEFDDDGDDFVHPKFSTHDDEAKQDGEVNEEDSFDPRVQTPCHVESTNDEDSDDVIQDANSSSVSSGFVSNTLNPRLDTVIDSIFTLTTEATLLVDVLVTTIVKPPLVSASTLPPPPTPLISNMQQTLVPTPTIIPSSSLQDLPNFSSLFGFDHRLKTLETDFSKFKQTNQFAEAISSIPDIVDAYLANKMHEAVKTAVQLQSDKLIDEALAKNEAFLNSLDDNIKKIIKDQVKKQVKAQVSKILPRIKKMVNKQLEAEVMTRSSTESKTSHVVAANLSELELKKILIDKMESNKSIHRSDEQKNLYKALMMRIKTKNPQLDQTRGPREDELEKSKTTGKSTDGSKSQHKSAGESAHIEEPMHIDKDLEEPTHQEFDIGATEELSDEETSQHPNCNLAREEVPLESFDELMDTPLDFSAFMMNRLKIDTLTPELLAGPTFELMKGTCKSLVELEYFFEEVYKATTDQLDWHNPEGQQYPHDLRKPLPLIPNSRGRQVIPFDHFINNDLAYLSGGVSSRTYATSVTKTKAADYGHIKWIEDLVPNTIWSEVPVNYDKHALWGISHWGRKRQQFYGFAANRESARDVYSKRRIIAVIKLQVVEWHGYKHLDWITIRKLTNLNVEDRIESYQKKLNIIKPDTYRSDHKRKDAYTAYSNPKGFIYQNKDKKNKLMRIDELHKFSDGTLDDVRTALNDCLKGIRMEYLPNIIWRQSDRERAEAMIQAIDKQLKSRRIMRSLENLLVGDCTRVTSDCHLSAIIHSEDGNPALDNIKQAHGDEVTMILKDGGEVVSDDPLKPPGFTKIVEEENKESGKGDSEVNGNECPPENNTMPQERARSMEEDYQYDFKNGSDKVVSNSGVDSSLPRGQCPQIASSLLEKMNEFVEIGQAIGFSMEGCEKDVKKLISRQGELSEKRMLWNYLHGVINRWHGEVIIIGDFNEVRIPLERIGSNFNKRGVAMFNSFIESSCLSLIDISSRVVLFGLTWALKDAGKMSKLDRFLVLKGILCQFPGILGIILSRHLSDHRPIILKENSIDYGPMPFRMFHSWLSIDGFEQLVVDSNDMSYLKKKFQLLKQKIKSWVQHHRDSDKNKHKEIQKELESIDKKIDQQCGQEGLLNTRRDLWKMLWDIKFTREKDLAQKEKVKLAIEGDENLKYFHVDSNAVKHEFFQHFVNRFSCDVNAQIHYSNEVVFPTTLSQDQMVMLEAEVTNVEINKAVSDFGSDKSPGPDGYTFEFIRKFWEFGFGSTWRDWIMGCLVSSTASVLVNGSPTKDLMGVGGVKFEDVCIGASVIGCEPAKTPFKYLRVLVGSKMARIHSWDGVIDKVVAKLSKWKANTLSIGSRFTLIKSVLSSLPSYYFSIFKVPVGVLKRLEAIRSKFFRGVDSDYRKISWFSWDKVIASKVIGGLVIKAIHGVSGKLDRDIQVEWVLLSFRRPPRGGAESVQMEQLSNMVSSVTVSGGLDRWIWSLATDGEFSVKSARKHIDDGLCLLEGMPTRWSKLVPIKVNILCWRIALNKIPSRFNMSLRGLEIHFIKCPGCLVGVETTNHLFFSCSIATDIVTRILVWWGLPIIGFSTFFDWQRWFVGLKIRGEVKVFLEATFFVSWWIIWNFWNKLLFSSEIPLKASLFDLIVHHSFVWCNARARRNLNWVSWLKGPLYALM
ncbi:retrovirus-related pol polyprotein from transposon TNT 1-94 [Tanacetum coccineum]